MSHSVHGIPVVADPVLTEEQVAHIVSECIQAWAWEGRQLAKVELISDGQFIHICSYEKPSIQVVSLSSNKDEECNYANTMRTKYN